LILELFSKAYELFKKHAPSTSSQSRLTFFIALQIATAYHESGKDDLAVKFFERITKTYRKERWKSLLRPGLKMWCESARRLGAVESCLILMIEMLGLGKYIWFVGIPRPLFDRRLVRGRRKWRPLSRYNGNIEGQWTETSPSLCRYSYAVEYITIQQRCTFEGRALSSGRTAYAVMPHKRMTPN